MKRIKEDFQAYNDVYTTGKPIQELTWIVHQKNGGKRYIAGSVSLKKDEAGKPIGFYRNGPGCHRAKTD